MGIREVAGYYTHLQRGFRRLGHTCRAAQSQAHPMEYPIETVALPLLGPLYDRYSFTALPAIGGMVAGDREAYQYLVESIRKFPPQQELAAMMRAAGFELVDWQNLSGGICAIHAGWRI